ncbi:MAG TPA: GTPase Era [Sphaerochaeta sp.]|jgi:GTP-binding protein Era|nr:GTPase Era [Sphaerochaeta sp.]HPZ16717.1 GTPase Era [Sphaerochaeta sp.]
MNETTKCGTVAIVGRPSSGKSTLLNTICEMKVAITSRTPQTTRNAIRGIYTDKRGQLIFTDTPGFHLSDKTLNKRLQQTAIRALGESDMILYLLDATRESGEEEEQLALLVKRTNSPVVLAVNKAEIASEEEKTNAAAFLATHFPSTPVLFASAEKDEGVDEILIALFAFAPYGELLYPADAYTDQDVEFRIAEILREKAMNLVSEEIPHAIYSEVADLEYDEKTNTVWIRAFITVERETQKAIVVGKGGSGIAKIRAQAEPEIREIFAGRKLRLDLRVKAQDKWRTNPIVLDKILR